MGVGGNGQWVRARTEEGAKAFVAEQEMEAERLRDRAQRSREFRQRVAARLRSWLRRPSSH